MKTWQKAIKYAATALAIFLIVSIISGIAGAMGIISSLSDKGVVLEEMKTHPVSGNITSLKVEINAADFVIQLGDSFSVESNLEKLIVKEKNGALIIEDPTKGTFGYSYKDAKLILVVPADFVFTKADIVTGAGKLSVDRLSCEHLSLILGAGEAIINELSATDSAEITGGAGSITIKSGVLNDLDLEIGVGELNMTALLIGQSDLELGVGEVKLSLLGSKDDYKIRFSKGLGDASINGEQMKDDRVYGNGTNLVEIDGGVGSIKIDFAAQ